MLVLTGAAVGAAAVVACSAAPTDVYQEGAVGQTIQAVQKPGPGTTAAEPESDTHPPAIATLHLDNGNVLEFYSAPRGALVMESGAAYTRPMFDGRGVTADQLVRVWQELAPDKPAPEALVALQERLTHLPPEEADAGSSKPRGNPGIEGVAFEPGEDGPHQGVTIDSPSGCNNGCCDYEWLDTFKECHTGGYYSWFLYNYGWSYVNEPEITHYYGLVCSALGTSEYHLDIDGWGGTWSVLEAHYRRPSWVAGTSPFCGWWCDEPLVSSVNSPSNEHMHTYCGYVYDED